MGHGDPFMPNGLLNRGDNMAVQFWSHTKRTEEFTTLGAEAEL